MTKQKKNSRWQGYDPRYIYSLVVRRYFADMKTKIEGNDSNLLIVFYVQIMPDDFVMQLHRF